MQNFHFNLRMDNVELVFFNLAFAALLLHGLTSSFPIELNIRKIFKITLSIPSRTCNVK